MILAVCVRFQLRRLERRTCSFVSACHSSLRFCDLALCCFLAIDLQSLAKLSCFSCCAGFFLNTPVFVRVQVVLRDGVAVQETSAYDTYSYFAYYLNVSPLSLLLCLSLSLSLALCVFFSVFLTEQPCAKYALRHSLTLTLFCVAELRQSGDYGDAHERRPRHFRLHHRNTALGQPLSLFCAVFALVLFVPGLELLLKKKSLAFRIHFNRCCLLGCSCLSHNTLRPCHSLALCLSAVLESHVVGLGLWR